MSLIYKEFLDSEAKRIIRIDLVNEINNIPPHLVFSNLFTLFVASATGEIQERSEELAKPRYLVASATKRFKRAVEPNIRHGFLMDRLLYWINQAAWKDTQ